MVSQTIGWENGGVPFTRTADGGAHWIDVAPPGLGNCCFHAWYLDATHAWITEETLSSVTTLRTVDGARTWQRGAPITADLPYGGTPRLYFVDAAHGWLLLFARKGVAYADALYRTADGGAHWALAATNTAPRGWRPGKWDFCYQWCQGSFASMSTGWLMNCCWSDRPQPRLLVSHDGGVSWKPQSLPPLPAKLSCPCSAAGPFPFDQLHAMVLIRGGLRDGPPSFAPTSALLVTSDAGAVWSIRSLPGEAQMAVGFYDANHGWAIAGSNALFASLLALEKPFPASAPAVTLPLYRTDDGGVTWAQVRTNLLLQSKDGQIAVLAFLDDRSGFAIRSTVDPRLTTDPPTYQQLLKTTDGGHNWTVVGTLP